MLMIILLHRRTQAVEIVCNQLQKTVRLQQLFRDFPGVSTAVAAFANHVAI